MPKRDTQVESVGWVERINRLKKTSRGSSRDCVMIFAYGIVKCLPRKTFRTILPKKLSV